MTEIMRKIWRICVFLFLRVTLNVCILRIVNFETVEGAISMPGKVISLISLNGKYLFLYLFVDLLFPLFIIFPS